MWKSIEYCGISDVNVVICTKILLSILLFDELFGWIRLLYSCIRFRQFLLVLAFSITRSLCKNVAHSRGARVQLHETVKQRGTKWSCTLHSVTVWPPFPIFPIQNCYTWTVNSLLLLECQTIRMTSSSASLSKQHKATAPYGSWKSPISADLVSGASKLLAGTAVDALGRLIYLESRPSQSGYKISNSLVFPLIHTSTHFTDGQMSMLRRMVLVRESNSNQEPVDITPDDFSVRTVLMGSESGGAFYVSGDSVIFSNYQDQRLYKRSMSSSGNVIVNSD